METGNGAAVEECVLDMTILLNVDGCMMRNDTTNRQMNHAIIVGGPSVMMILFALPSSIAIAKEPHVSTSIVGNVNDPETAAAAIGTDYRQSWSRNLSPKSCMTSFRTHPSMTSSAGSLMVEVF